MGISVHEKSVEIFPSPPPPGLKLLPPMAPKGSHGDPPHDKLSDEHYHHEEHQVNEKVQHHNKILTSLLAGAMAGAVAKTVIAPLDRTKINFQISNQVFSFRKALGFISQTVKNEGFLRLWRGNSATMARIIPYASIQYASHEQYKSLLQTDKRKKHLPPGRRALAGALAGVTSVTATYPLDMVRARMAVTNKHQYQNLPQVVMKIYREEGARILYRGYNATILGVIPYSATSFFTYETLKKKHAELCKGCEPTAVERMGFGALAGFLGQSTSYPLDIVRRRMQTAGVTGHAGDYTSIIGTARMVISEEGFIRGMYKGLSMNWIKGPIAVGTSFMTYDITLRWLRKLIIKFHLDES